MASTAAQLTALATDAQFRARIQSLLVQVAGQVYSENPQATASFPTLKRNGVGIDVRLADDSGYGNVTASGVFAAAAFFGPGTYATTGDVRLRHTAQINGRDSTNATDVILLDWGGTTDTLTVGQAGFDTVVHGKINLSPGANDIKWGKALVALGTTSLITLGKTGGSGPATVAQDSWMRVLDSTGAAFFVPVWK